MNNEKVKLTATMNGKEVNLLEVIVKMEFGGEKAEVDADTIVRRSLHLVQENTILRQALLEAQAIFEAQEQSKVQIATPDEVNQVVKEQVNDYRRKQDF